MSSKRSEWYLETSLTEMLTMTQLWTDDQLADMVHRERLRQIPVEHVGANVAYQMLRQVRDDLQERINVLTDRLQQAERKIDSLEADGPVWRGGIPDNLTAAAMDALEWLRHIETAQPVYGAQRAIHLTAGNRKRLVAAIKALEANIPPLLMVQESERADDR